MGLCKFNDLKCGRGHTLFLRQRFDSGVSVRLKSIVALKFSSVCQRKFQKTFYRVLR